MIKTENSDGKEIPRAKTVQENLIVTQKTMESCRLPSPFNTNGNLANNWKIFKQQFEIYLLASEKMQKEKNIKAAILLNLIGEDGLQLFNNFNLSTADQKDVDKILDEFDKFCNPKQNIVYERYKFNQRNQKSGENFDSFLADLKKLILTCDYGDEESSILRDRIVLGICDSVLQEKLLGIENLNERRAIDACRAAELTKTQARDVQGQHNGKHIDALQKKPANAEQASRKGHHHNSFKDNKQGKHVSKFNKNSNNGNMNHSSHKINCFRCGFMHELNKCPAFGKSCKKCGTANHFAKQCKVKMGRTGVGQVSRIIQSNNDDNNCLYIDTLKLNSISDRSWCEVIKLENSTVNIKIDTGAEANIIPYYLYEKISKSEIGLEKTNTVLEAYGGSKIETLGTCSLFCEYKNQRASQIFYVLKNKSDPILGLKSSEILGIVKRVHSITSGKEKFITENNEIFEGIGTFKDKCSLRIKESA